jgi:hypothetical protein
MLAMTLTVVKEFPADAALALGRMVDVGFLS